VQQSAAAVIVAGGRVPRRVRLVSRLSRRGEDGKTRDDSATGPSGEVAACLVVPRVGHEQGVASCARRHSSCVQ
jgi:hypothetical protein